MPAVMLRGKHKQQTFIRGIAIYVIIVFVLSWAAAGCGKKGPPVPPREKESPAVNDLSASVQGSLVTLTWSIHPDADQVSGYIVYREKKAASDPECPDCPRMFERMSDMGVDDPEAVDPSGEKMVFRETLEHGYKYYYKVKAYTEGGGEGSGSNVVTILMKEKEENDPN